MRAEMSVPTALVVDAATAIADALPVMAALNEEVRALRTALREIAAAVDETSADPAEIVKSVIGHMGALRMYQQEDAL